MNHPSTPFSWQEPLLQDLRNLSKQLETENQFRSKSDDTSSSRGLRSIFKDQLSAGGGESFSAEEHRGREVLELFQNASDKCSINNSLGAVYIALTDEGLLVANTGESFDFSQDDTRDALSIFGYTDKTQDEVGKFGVGLTSIRATGEAYEVWTKNPKADTLSGHDCWRVRCGPENILAPIAQAFEETANSDPINQLRNDLQAVAGAEELLPCPTKTPNMEFDLHADEFPYFLRPLPLRNWRDHTESSEELTHLEQRAEQLLKGTWDSAPDIPTPAQNALTTSDIESFTTAVFVEYQNETWRQLYTSLSDDSNRERADPQALHEQAWYNGRDSSKITPELLLTLGEADTVIVESWLTDASDSEAQVWDVDPAQQSGESISLSVNSLESIDDPENTGPSDDSEKKESVDVDLKEVQAVLRSNSKAVYKFWHISFTDGRTFDEVPWFEDPANSPDDSELHGTAIDAQLLVPKQGSEHSYRPHLYYPISGLDATFAACLHAEFAVQQDRQSLDGNATMQNACVTGELARLIGCAAEALSRCEAVDDWLALRMPWRLLPPSTDSNELPRERAEEGSATDKDILNWLYTASAARLRSANTIPTVATSHSLSSVGDPLALPGDSTLLKGLVALYRLDGTIDNADHLEEIQADVDLYFPTSAALTALTAWANNVETLDRPEMSRESPVPDPRNISNGETDRLARLKSFLSTGHMGLSVTEWQYLLTEWATTYRTSISDPEKVAIETEATTATALLEATMTIATSDDESTPDTSTLNKFVPSQGPGPFLLPCNLSSSSDQSSSERTVWLVCIEDHTGRNPSKREVLRPDESTQINLVTAASEAFNTYQLTQEIAESIQAIKNADWGTTDIDGQLALFRSFLKAASSSGSVGKQELKLLARYYNEIEDPPETTPGAYHSQELVEEIVTAKGTDDFNNRHKTRLEARRTDLSSSLLSGKNTSIGRNVQYDDFCRGLHPELPSELSGVTTVDDAPQIEANSESILKPDTETVIHTLSMLGVSLLPGICTITRYRDIGLQSGEWNPLAPNSWSNIQSDDNRVGDLKVALQNTRPSTSFASFEALYCDLIVAPGFNPSTATDHTSSCNVKTYLESSGNCLSEYDVMLATWVWMRTDYLREIRLNDLVSVLEHIGDQLAETVFATGWSCKDGKGSANGIIQPIPTLLSWQLRCLHGWETTDGVDILPPKQPDESSSSSWTKPDPGWSLVYAVKDEAGSQSTGSRGIDFLPRVSMSDSDNTTLSAETLDALGVKQIDDLTAAEAALRLQALLNNYAVLAEDQATVLFGGALPQGWKTLYKQLLQPIFKAYHDTSRDATKLFPYLSHIPVLGLSQGGKAWFALPIELLSESVVYYDHLPHVWETRIQDLADNESPDEDSEMYLLEGAPTGKLLDGFTDFAKAHDVDPEERTYPTIPSDAKTTTPDAVREILSRFDYKKNILAAAPGRQAEQYQENVQKYDNAIRSLRAVDPETDLFSGHNWAYQPLEDTGGFQVSNMPTGRARPVISADVDEDSLPEIAGLFEAMFTSGRSDSFKLALTGQDVDGVEEAIQHLASQHHVNLLYNIRQITSLLDVEIDVEFDEHDPAAYRDLTNQCVAALDPEKTSSWESGTDTELQTVITQIITSTDAPAYTRRFAAEWLRGSPSKSTVLTILSDPPGDPPSGWKTNFLRKVLSWVDDCSTYLPDDLANISRFSGVVIAIREEPTVEDIPHVEWRQPWYHSVNFEIEGTTPDPISDRTEIPDTWFELAWSAKTDGELFSTEVVDSKLFLAYETALVQHIAGDDDEEQEAVRTKLRNTITGNRESTNDSSSTPDSEIYAKLGGEMISTSASGSLSALSDSLSIQASRRSDTSKTRPENSTDAPRAAELQVIRSVVEDIVDTDVDPQTVESAAERLQDDPHQWHYSSHWERLPDPPLDEFRSLDGLERPDASYLHRLCNMANEPIVGFDVLDLSGGLVPTDAPGLGDDGAASVQSDSYPVAINPVPIEVKSVGDATQPQFRFTTNQVRRALQFVSPDRDGPQRPFMIQFVELSKTEKGFVCENASAQVLTRPADVYDLLGLDIEHGADAVEELLMQLVRRGHFQIE